MLTWDTLKRLFLQIFFEDVVISWIMNQMFCPAKISGEKVKREKKNDSFLVSLNVRNLSVLVLPVTGHAQIYSSMSLRERWRVKYGCTKKKKKARIKMSCSNAAVQRQEGKTINGPLSVMILAVLTQASSVRQYGSTVISKGGKSPPFWNALLGRFRITRPTRACTIVSPRIVPL